MSKVSSKVSSAESPEPTTVSTMTGGQAVVKALIDQGIDTLFGLPGIQNDWLYNALYDARDKIKVIHSRHEQGVAYMALGSYLATGKPSVFNVVPGPGLLNASAALATAYGLGAKVLCLTGQIPLNAIGRDIGLLHELPDQLGILARLSKWSARINHPSEPPYASPKLLPRWIQADRYPQPLKCP
ncbi:MAG: thiamine pyrophosphate-binding protein [Deinococcales bacterium]